MLKKILLILALSLIPLTIAHAKIPNDPLVKQWAFEHTGVYSAWDYTVGSKKVVVAVIDNGFDMFHPDLKNNVWKNEKEIANNNIDDDRNGYIDDMWGWNFLIEDANEDGEIDEREKFGNNNPQPAEIASKEGRNEAVIHHGTLVAGLIGAAGNNREGISGVNWQIKLMNLKVVDNSGYGSLSQLGRAIRYAVDNGAKIINISMVGDESDDIKKAVEYAYKKGVIVVAAAGNNMNSLNEVGMYPICADSGEQNEWVLGVSAIGENHRLASFSNIGSDCVDITAPGVNITSTIRYWEDQPQIYEGGYSGTSFAAPIVSGAAALIKSLHPEWGPKQIYQALITTVHHTPGQDESVYANLFGAGLLQIDQAVKKAFSEPIVKHFGDTLMTVDLNKGIVKKKTLDFDNISTHLLGFENFIDFTAFKNGVETWFLGTKKIATGYELYIYDKKFRLAENWSVQSKGKLKFLAGDFNQDKKNEIAAYSQENNQGIFEVFDIKGNLIKAKENEEQAKVFMAKGLGRLVSLYKKAGVWSAHYYQTDFTEESAVVLNGIDEPVFFAVGDLENDEKLDLIILKKEKGLAYLMYFSENGKLKKNISLGKIAVSGMQIVDYNSDANEELLLFPSQSNEPIMVMNNKGKKIADIYLQKDSEKLMLSVI